MDVTRALDQIAEIHEQIAKGEVYRGYRSLPVAASGLIGHRRRMAAARSRSASADPVGFVLYWTAIAAAAGFVGSSEIIYNYVVHDDASAAGRHAQVVGQFLPSVVGGAAITVCFTHLSAALVPLLPGLWAFCFGLGTFASRPYLPRASGWIALFYYAAGSCCSGSRAARNRSRAGGSAARSASASCSPHWSCGGIWNEPAP